MPEVLVLTVVSVDVDADVAVDVWGVDFLTAFFVDLCVTDDVWDLTVSADETDDGLAELLGFGVECAFTDTPLSSTDNTTMQNATLMNELSNPELLKVKSL